MFFAPLVTLAFAATALASPYKRADGLVVSLTAKDTSVHSIADVTLTAKVENTGSEAIKVLKYGTVLDNKLPTRSFKVTKGDSEVEFTGVKIQVSLKDADDSAYAIIPAGGSITVEHQIASLFDFESAGTGAFTFTPVTDFQSVSGESSFADSVDELVTIESSVSSATVEVTSDVKKRSVAEKRAVDICTNSSQKSFLDAAYSESKSLASIAANYISSNSGSSLYTSYWGTNSATTVRGRFTTVANENSSSRTLSCTDTYGACSSGVIAYTLIATTNIYVCSIFFNEVTTSRLCSGTTVASRNIRGGTILHEMTHATSGTDDVTYGCSADQALSTANKLKNADNYNCFSTQVYASTQC
jgi:deuterolysin